MRKVFIPLSIENTSTRRQSYFASGSKGLMLTIAIVPSLFWIPFASSLTMGSPLGMIAGVLSYLVFLVTILRFGVFEENRFKKDFYNLYENKISSFQYFWGIDRIDEDGIIHYKYEGDNKLRKAFVIKLVRGNIVGKGSDYSRRFKDTMKRIYGAALSKHLEIQCIEMHDNRSIPVNVLHMYNNVAKIQNEKARELARDHVNNIVWMAKHKQQLDVIYLVITFEDALMFKNMKNVADNIVSIARNSDNFKICKQIQKYEVEKFIEDYLAIRGIKAFELVNNIKTLDEYGTVIKLFDKDGNEEWFDEETIYEEIKNYKGTEVGKIYDNSEEQALLDAVEKEINEESVEKMKKKTKFHRKVNKDRLEKLSATLGLDDEDDEFDNDTSLEEDSEDNVEIKKKGFFRRK